MEKQKQYVAICPEPKCGRTYGMPSELAAANHLLTHLKLLHPKKGEDGKIIEPDTQAVLACVKVNEGDPLPLVSFTKIETAREHEIKINTGREVAEAEKVIASKKAR